MGERERVVVGDRQSSSGRERGIVVGEREG